MNREYLMNRELGINSFPSGCMVLSSLFSQLIIYPVILIHNLFHMEMTQPCWSSNKNEKVLLENI